VLTINAFKTMEDLKVGDSICTNGICLTVTDYSATCFMVDVMPETLRKTSLGELKTGSPVNLERALRLSDRLGGHMVSGHIDGTGRISKIWEEDNALWISITADHSILKYIIERGSVALDGVSLTVTSVDKRSFSVSIIPHTQNETILTGKSVGDPVNIECDMIAKYVEKLSTPQTSGSKIDLEFLKKNDYL
jgi:riboflavin synthase